MLREGAIVAHGEAVGLVGLSVHHQNVGVIMTHDFKAHVPFPPTELNSRGRRGAPALTSMSADIVCPAFPTPRAAPRVEQKLTSRPGLNNGGNAKILGKQTGPCTGLAPPLSG